MPSLSELPSNLKRKNLNKALSRLGFIIDMKGGAESHMKVTWPQTQKCITIQKDLRKDVLYYVLKEIEECSGITWDRIKIEL